MGERLAKALVVVAVFAAGVAGFFLGNPQHKLEASQDEVCRAQCAHLNKMHRLAPSSRACECY